VHGGACGPAERAGARPATPPAFAGLSGLRWLVMRTIDLQNSSITNGETTCTQ